MTSLTWTRTGVFASVLLVGLASFVLAKKPPKDPPPEPPPPPILYEIEWLPENFDTRARDVEVVDDILVVVGKEGGLGVDERAFVYTELAGMMDLTSEAGVTGITLTSAGCINDVGQIAGKYVDGEGVEGIYVYDLRADVLYRHPLSDVSRVTDISDGSLPDSWDGTVVGYRSGSDVSPGDRGFAWKPAQDPEDEYFEILPIDPLYDATGINRSGEVVGRMHLFNYGPIFRYTLGTSELEILSDTSRKGSSGYRDTTIYYQDRIDVNDSGIVAGNVAVKNDFAPAYFTDNEGWQELTLDERAFSSAINNVGQICGIISIESFRIADTGFVYDPDDGYWSLNDLVVGHPEDVELWFAGDARDKRLPRGMSHPDGTTGYGTIVGYKWIQAAGYRGFVLRPLPAPTE